MQMPQVHLHYFSTLFPSCTLTHRRHWYGSFQIPLKKLFWLHEIFKIIKANISNDKITCRLRFLSLNNEISRKRSIGSQNVCNNLFLSKGPIFLIPQPYSLEVWRDSTLKSQIGTYCIVTENAIISRK